MVPIPELFRMSEIYTYSIRLIDRFEESLEIVLRLSVKIIFQSYTRKLVILESKV